MWEPSQAPSYKIHWSVTSPPLARDCILWSFSLPDCATCNSLQFSYSSSFPSQRLCFWSLPGSLDPPVCVSRIGGSSFPFVLVSQTDPGIVVGFSVHNAICLLLESGDFLVCDVRDHMLEAPHLPFFLQCCIRWQLKSFWSSWRMKFKWQFEDHILYWFQCCFSALSLFSFFFFHAYFGCVLIILGWIAGWGLGNVWAMCFYLPTFSFSLHLSPVRTFLFPRPFPFISLQINCLWARHGGASG